MEGEVAAACAGVDESGATGTAQRGPVLQRRWAFRDSTALFCKGALPRDPNALREYQVKSLGRLLDAEGRALSGNAKMPCGACKTLLALWHAVRLETYTLVLTSSNMSTLQWVSQLRRHFELPADAVLALGTGMPGSTDGRNERHRLLRARPLFVICTYHTLTLHGAAGSAVALLRALPHGLLVLDEAQTLVALCFSRALAIPCTSVLAISATFKRQDQRIELLEQVGPLLIDVLRGLLVSGGFLAEVG